MKRALVWLALPVLAILPATGRDADAESPVASPASDNAELAAMYEADQADRHPAGDGRPIDWTVVSGRDAARLARAKELLAAGKLGTGADYYHAAMILQHSAAADDHLLAHELCVVALGEGEERGRWLAAASEDRFLMNIGRPQRFGTQFRRDPPSGPWYLYEVDPNVSDAQRAAMDVPPLAEARKRVETMNARP